MCFFYQIFTNLLPGYDSFNPFDIGITAIFVTYDQDEAMVMSDTIHLLYQGKIE
ncbi:MAG: hypothetical protein PHP50_14895 [Lachnospiraceae bacterium]|nr:hypothetical protein [Lachnospiraceae bacterium]